ncbi:MAG: LEA type 2 family protein [Gallionellaceae bacterium]|nr:LEA type 2 family protein [Gallionellaceae bacterium]
MRHLLWVSLISLALTGCASLSDRDMPKVDVAGIEAMPSQSMELRLAVTLRILNPSEYSIEYNGLYVEMDVQGMRFASGVSNQSGTIPRYGESVISVPVTISALAMVRQVIGLAGKERAVPLTYEVRGKVAGPVFNSQRFTSRGEFKLPTTPDGNSKP